MGESSVTNTYELSTPRKSSFAGDVLKLVSGTAFAQALAIVVAPVLTRLYGPEAFGTSALFASLAGIIGAVACLRYELAIVLPKTDEEAANLLGVSLVSVVLISLLTVPLVCLGGEPLARWLNAPELGQYLWLVPLVVFLSGVFLALNYWNSRTRRFGRLSIALVSSSTVTASAQLGAGVAGCASGGTLVFANIAGSFVSTLVLAGQVWRDDGR